MLDALAREVHFLDHLAPTWLALPEQLRGTFYVHRVLVDAAAARGVEAQPITEALPGPLMLVASYRDLKLAREWGRLCVYSEHGAGQSYVGVKSGSYIGSPDRGSVVAALVPGYGQAARHHRAHPTIPAHAVGVPKLDHLHRATPKPMGKPPVVALSFHWNCRLAPEARGTISHYGRILPTLAKQFSILGHGHPRAIRSLRRRYDKAGIELVTDFAEVIERADVYVCDTSSTMYEWASLDRPVVVLNAPFYRRKIEHGLRFWEHADLGPQVWRGADLPAAIERAIEDPPEIAARRREIAETVYVACDGKATERTVDALIEIHEQWGADAGATLEPSLHDPPPVGVG